MIEMCVVNASPLIFLSRAGHLGLLRASAAAVRVPQPVADELRARGVNDVTANDLNSRRWLEITEPLPIPPGIMQWGLGPGESAVLAESLRLPNVIPAARPVMEDLLRGGMFLSRPLLDRALALVGE
jgi:predicted nucleic acid-binding protein